MHLNFRRNLNKIVIFLLILIIFLVNASYLSYPDEFVNLLGGKYLIEGKILYKEFFDHHMPLAWYLSSIFLRFSFGSFILFRIYWALFSFGLLGILGRWINKNHWDIYPYYLNLR